METLCSTAPVLKVIAPSDLPSGSSFGSAVLLDVTDSAWAVIGASGNASLAGQAFVVNPNTGVVRSRFVASAPEAGDEFGAALAMDARIMECDVTNCDRRPHTFILVGAPGTRGTTSINSRLGAAYLFVFNRQSGNTTFHRKLLPGDDLSVGADAHFGCSVALSNQRAFVGARGRNARVNRADYAAGPHAFRDQGAVYVFDIFSGVQVAIILPAPELGGLCFHFGASISISGDTLAVGAPNARGACSQRANAGAVMLFSIHPPPPPPPPLCGEECYPSGFWSSNGICDDGGSGAEFSDCAIGTDCSDCGPRNAAPPPPPISNMSNTLDYSMTSIMIPQDLLSRSRLGWSVALANNSAVTIVAGAATEDVEDAGLAGPHQDADFERGAVYYLGNIAGADTDGSFTWGHSSSKLIGLSHRSPGFQYGPRFGHAVAVDPAPPYGSYLALASAPYRTRYLLHRTGSVSVLSMSSPPQALCDLNGSPFVDIHEGDEFGKSVVVHAGRAIVGAPGYRNGTGIDSRGAPRGAVYIFDFINVPSPPPSSPLPLPPPPMPLPPFTLPYGDESAARALQITGGVFALFLTLAFAVYAVYRLIKPPPKVMPPPKERTKPSLFIPSFLMPPAPAATKGDPGDDGDAAKVAGDDGAAELTMAGPRAAAREERRAQIRMLEEQLAKNRSILTMMKGPMALPVSLPTMPLSTPQAKLNAMMEQIEANRQMIAVMVQARQQGVLGVLGAGQQGVQAVGQGFQSVGPFVGQGVQQSVQTVGQGLQAVSGAVGQGFGAIGTAGQAMFRPVTPLRPGTPR